jgi:extracellular elastinolytic metalloproteinase
MPQRSARHVRPLALVASLAAAAATTALLPASAGALGETQQRAGQGTYDVRAAVAVDDPSAPGAAARALARRLGSEGVVRLDPVTGTPRQLLRTDGALTGRSSSPPARIALDYVRAHAGVFGLTGSELSALGAPQTTRSPAGIRRLRWTQSYRGLPVIGAGLRAAVAGDGRLISLSGAPLPDASVASTAPQLSREQALARVRRDAGAPAGAGDDPRLVIFSAHDGPRLAWTVRVDADSTHRYSYVLDAGSGAILKRSNLVRFADSGAAGGAWSFAPGDGGNFRMINDAWRAQPRTFNDGWITSGGSRLKGENAHVYSDVDDDDIAGLSEEIRSSATNLDGLPEWAYPFRAAPGWNFCSATFPCSWRSLYDQTGADGWNGNREQNAVQVFWFLNTYKEHLEAPPIGFTRAEGNFSGDDYVVANTDDGADGTYLDAGTPYDHHPDPSHLNNANMYTPPDGESPRMQMYLFMPGDPDVDPIVDANGGDDASIVYHEYTHGLSSRLVTDTGLPTGEQALNAPQSGAMAEAWSDWYAMDFLASEGYQLDTADDGEVLIGSYLTGGETGPLREAALDCPARNTVPGCIGFTYADYGKVLADYGPEVHADGEIWAQTLWDLRSALIRAEVETAVRAGHPQQEGIDAGVASTRMLVTEAMRSSDPEPSFLTMRDDILAANVADAGVDQGTRDDRRALIWQVFADRGMGYYADTLDAYDPAPIADFHVPPPPATPTAALSGTVTDAETGAPVAGARVRLPGVDQLEVTTDAGGHYRFDAALAGGPYPRLLADRGGYATTTVSNVTVAPGGTTERNLTLRRDWALTSGGATVAGFTGPDLTGLRCGPSDALDGTSAYGWGSYVPGYDGSAHGLPIADRAQRRLVLRLPAAVDVTSFEIDPGAICGDDDSASLGEFALHTSTDGVNWRMAATGTFGRANNHRLNLVPPNAGTTAGVRWVRVTMLSPQGGRGASGAYFLDMAELAVYGAATGAIDPPGPPDPPDPGPPADPGPSAPGPGGSGTPAPGPGAQGPTGSSGTSRRPTAKPKLSNVAVPLPKRRSLRTLLGKAGVPLRLRADERVKVIATITLPAATARRLRMSKQRRGTVAIARLSNAAVAANRTTTLRVRLPRNTRVWLDRAQLRTLTFGVAILATAADGDVAAKLLSATARR